MLRHWRSSLLSVLCSLSSLLPAAAQQPEANPGQADRARLARLSELAHALQDPAADGPALATEAARLCGFVLWDENRAVVAEPLGAPRLFLAVTVAELRGMTELLRAGHRVGRDDLLAGVDVLYGSLGLPGSAVPAARAWLRDGASTSNAAARALWSFLEDLGVQHGARIDGEADVELDPLQALLILRVLSEDIATPLRRALARGELGAGAPTDRGDRPKGPFAAPGEPFADAPGWAEDAYVGGITGLFTEVVEGLGKVGKGIGDAAGKANAVATIGKFLLTYTFLKGRVWDDDPDNPLIRTKTRDAGQQCTLHAAFWIDGSKVTDWLKDHRQMAALAGLDLDMPKSGPLKGIETEWDIQQDRNSSKYHLIQTVRGQPDISKIKTDDEGIATIEVEGCPQPRKIDATQAMPVEKKVRMVVTPQVKATEMQQDLVDAVTGAIGIRGGGVGLLTPVIECLYRMKWKGGVVYDLQVRDWVAGETIGQAEVSIAASGSRFSRTSAFRRTINRKLVFTDVTMDVQGFDPPPPPDPQLLKMVPKAMREQMEEGYRQMAELAKKRMFLGKNPGRGELHIHDSSHGNQEEATCEVESGESWSTWDGDGELTLADNGFAGGPVMFLVDCDLEKKVAKLRLTGAIDTRVVTFRRTGREPGVRTDEQHPLDVFAGLQLQPPFANGEITMTLKETPGVDPGVVHYYGVTAVPVTFSGFQGTMHVSWSVHRRIKKDK